MSPWCRCETVLGGCAWQPTFTARLLGHSSVGRWLDRARQRVEHASFGEEVLGGGGDGRVRL